MFVIEYVIAILTMMSDGNMDRIVWCLMWIQSKMCETNYKSGWHNLLPRTHVVVRSNRAYEVSQAVRLS